MFTATHDRLDWLAGNPLNISGIPGYPVVSLREYVGAQFEREGFEAPLGSQNPYHQYNPLSMASTRWQAGNDYASARAHA